MTGLEAVPNVLSPRDLVFRPDLSDKNWPQRIMLSKSLTKVCVCEGFTTAPWRRLHL